MDKPSTSGLNEFSSASACSQDSPSKIPVRSSKRKQKLEPSSLEPKAKQPNLQCLEAVEQFMHISDDEMFVDEPMEEVIPQCSQVQDIRSIFQRFQEFNTKMASLNETMYLCLGFQDDYERLEKQLMGFLGELHYRREKEEALNRFYRYSSEK